MREPRTLTGEEQQAAIEYTRTLRRTVERLAARVTVLTIERDRALELSTGRYTTGKERVALLRTWEDNQS